MVDGGATKAKVRQKLPPGPKVRWKCLRRKMSQKVLILAQPKPRCARKCFPAHFCTKSATVEQFYILNAFQLLFNPLSFGIHFYMKRETFLQKEGGDTQQEERMKKHYTTHQLFLFE